MDTKLYDGNASFVVLSHVYKNPEILMDEKFTLSLGDFESSPIHQYIFSAMYNLVIGNEVTKLNTEDIQLYISKYPKQSEEFTKQGGPMLLNHMMKRTSDDDGVFKMNYNTVKKLTVLRELKKNGIYLSEFKTDSWSNFEEREKWEQVTVEDIIKKVQEKVNKVENSYISPNASLSQKAAKGIKELYWELKNNPEIGVSLDGDILDYILRGARYGKMYLNSAPSGHGKAIPNNTSIPTPSGFKLVGDVKVGDMLFDRTGEPTKVLGVYPQGKKEVFEITFKDGRKAKSSEDHIWSVWNYRGNGFTDYTLKQLIEKVNKNGYQDNDGVYRYKVPTSSAAKFNQKELSIDPYTMGAMLGDGIFRMSERNKTLYISSQDKEIPEKIANNMGWSFYSTISDNYSWYFKDKNGSNIHIDDFLKNHQFLIGKYSEEKEIPEEYLTASLEQREQLIKGLFDTDAHIRPTKGSIIYYTSSKKMAEQVIDLVRGLGDVATLGEDERKEKYSNGISYAVYVQTANKCRYFYLSRKYEVAYEWENSKRRKQRYDSNAIVDIRSLGYEEDMTCFLVDNEEHLFLMNDFIVTHNTRFMVGNACAISLPRIENGKVVMRENLLPVLFVTTEQQADEIQTMLLAYVSGVNEEKILYGTANAKEEELILQAADLIKKYEDNFIIEVIPDPSIAIVRAKLVKHIIQNGIQFIFYDYIFSSPGLLGEFRDVKVREDVALMMLSNSLKEIAAVYNIFMQSATQLNDKWEQSMVRNQNHIRGSKAIVDKADVGMTSIKLEEVPEEKAIVEKIIAEAKLPMPNLVVDIYKNRRGKYTSIKLFRQFDYGTCRSRDIMLTTLTHGIIKNYDKIEYQTRIVDFAELMIDNMGGDEENVEIN